MNCDECGFRARHAVGRGVRIIPLCCSHFLELPNRNPSKFHECRAAQTPTEGDT